MERLPAISKTQSTRLVQIREHFQHLGEYDGYPDQSSRADTRIFNQILLLGHNR